MILIALLSAVTFTAGAKPASPAGASAAPTDSSGAMISRYVRRLAEASGAEVVAPWVPLLGWNAFSPRSHQSSFDAKATFNSVCASCHGKHGKGNGAAAAGMNPRPANFTDPTFWKASSDSMLFKVIKDGGASVGLSPLMPAWGSTYSDADIHALLSYIETTFRPKAAGGK